MTVRGLPLLLAFTSGCAAAATFEDLVPLDAAAEASRGIADAAAPAELDAVIAAAPDAAGLPPDVRDARASDLGKADVGSPTPDGPASAGGWIPLFNGKDLAGWKAKITKYDYGVNYANTFRVENGVIKVVYDQYQPYSFDGKFGLLFHEQPLSGSYVVRVEYRFTGPQAPNPPGWGYRNSGVMILSQAPETMGKMQDFCDCLEVQLLGGDNLNNGLQGPSGKHPPTANLCTLGTTVVLDGKRDRYQCATSSSPSFNDDVWVTVEIEVLGGTTIRHKVNGQTVMTYTDPQGASGTPVHGGYLALQSESYPVEFRKVELRVLAP